MPSSSAKARRSTPTTSWPAWPGKTAASTSTSMSRSSTSRKTLTLVLAACWALLPRTVRAEDAVVIATGNSNAGRVRLRGEIVEYTGKLLEIRSSGGAVQRVPAGKVLSVETTRTAAHVRGDELFQEGSFADAGKEYLAALDAEPREWVRRDVLARLVVCQRELGDVAAAGESFLTLTASDPETLHFACIPLDWFSDEPDAALAKAAQRWLKQ